MVAFFLGALSIAGNDETVNVLISGTSSGTRSLELRVGGQSSGC